MKIYVAEVSCIVAKKVVCGIRFGKRVLHREIELYGDDEYQVAYEVAESLKRKMYSNHPLTVDILKRDRYIGQTRNSYIFYKNQI
jgi:hypothetical protein